MDIGVFPTHKHKYNCRPWNKDKSDCYNTEISYKWRCLVFIIVQKFDVLFFGFEILQIWFCQFGTGYYLHKFKLHLNIFFC